MRRSIVTFAVVLQALATGSAWAADSPTLRQGTPAKPIDRRQPRYPMTARVELGEAWALASFVVRADGTVGDVLIDDSVGGEPFDEATVKAIEAWRYEPATLGGKPVDQCHHQVLLVYEISGQKKGASPPFVRRYKAAARKVDSGELDEAKAILDEMEAVNLYEASHQALLRAEIARREGDRAAQAGYLWRADIRDGRFLDPDVRAGVLIQKFALHVQANRLQEARMEYEALQKTGRDIPEPIQRLHRDLESAIAGDAPIAVPGELPGWAEGESGHTRWTHGLVRPVVTFEDVDGTIDHVDLRCDFHRASWAVKPDRAWRVPRDWGNCWLHVFGEPGTTFKLVAYRNTDGLVGVETPGSS